ncbi:MAG: zinc ribbon domain-containing protein [Gaiellales bacterium]
MFRRRRLKPDLLERRASDVRSIEATVYEVDEALTSALAASPAPTIGSARACSCGESIPEGARFCPACGLAVAGEDPLNTCAQCTASIPAGASFCGTCGATAGGGDSEARAGW